MSRAYWVNHPRSAGRLAGDLFAATSPGTRYQRIVTQLRWIGTIAREGSLFDKFQEACATAFELKSAASLPQPSGP